jgi:iron(III) transport system permease protein
MAAIPWAALLTAASLTTVERRLEEETLLDASPSRVLWRVTVRRGAGGVFVAAVWIAIMCATEITVTDLVQIRTFAEEIYTTASQGPLTGPEGIPPGDLQLGVAALALLAATALWLAAPWLPAAASIALDATWRWRPRRARPALAAAVWLLAAAVVCVPLVGLAWKAGIVVENRDGQFHRAWSAGKTLAMVGRSPWEHRREWGWSLVLGGAVAGSTVAVGTLLAWLAAARPKTAAPLGALAAFGLALPAPLLAVWVIALLNRPEGSALSWLTTLYDRTFLAPLVVEAGRALPLVGIWLWSQLASVPRDLLEASRSEGAGRLAQLVRIALPLRLPGVAMAGLAAAVIAVGELSATLLVAPPGLTTISMRIFQLLHNGVDDRLAALSLAIIGAIGVVSAGLGVIAAWGRRRVSQPPLR